MEPCIFLYKITAKLLKNQQFSRTFISLYPFNIYDNYEKHGKNVRLIISGPYDFVLDAINGWQKKDCSIKILNESA